MEAIVKFIMNLHLFHDWGQWTWKECVMMKHSAGGLKLYDYKQPYQERKCKVCGKIEHQDLRY